MKRNPQLWLAIGVVVWIMGWMILAIIDTFTHFIGIF